MVATTDRPISGGVALSLVRGMLRDARPRPVRTVRQFAEDEIVLPNGPYQGRAFRCDRQPYARLFLDELDAGRWKRVAATGPSQSGKTLTCYVIPLLYHLFELEETVVVGLPDLDMAADKWREDIRPVIQASGSLRRQLLEQGEGSRGGKVRAVTFANGATLRFMTGGGGDKSRAGFTSRVLVVTEVDGMDESGGKSREADKVSQLEARSKAFGDRARTYLECTVTTEDGRIWREYDQGSRSRILMPCVHCERHVELGRDNLEGWRGAETDLEARECAHWVCPACDHAWTDEEREASARESILVHAGQDVDDRGRITGEARRVETLGFRWSAADNLFVTAGDVGVDEWRAAQDPDEDNAERKMRQFVWCLPHEPAQTQSVELDTPALQRRMSEVPRGIVPDGCELITAGIDVGKYRCWYTVTAWHDDASGQVIDYGPLDTAVGDRSEEEAILATLREFREVCAEGWPRGRDQLVQPRLVLVDSGYQTETVYSFIRESGPGWLPVKGYGTAQRRSTSYRQPKTTSATVQIVGEQYHVAMLKEQRTRLVEVNADHWKGWLHRRLTVEPGKRGALVLFRAEPTFHRSFAKHITAEREVEEWEAGKGFIRRWEQIYRHNHLLDTTALSCVAGHLAGVRLMRVEDTNRERRTTKNRAKPASSWIGQGGGAWT